MPTLLPLVRASAFAFLLACALAACGQNSGPKELARIGDACTAGPDCGSGVCQRGVCTRYCVIQGDCPVNFDCTLQDPKDSAPTCYKTNYTNPDHGGYGTSCAVYAGQCGGANPCADGFTCHFHNACDGNAYCTKGCAKDVDCPADMFCGKDKSDSPLECLKRVACEPCGTDDQCPANHVCATDKNGERYCAKTCKVATDCHKPNNDVDTGKPAGAPFEVCADDPGGKGTVCQPAGGVCHGPSALASMPTGQVCSPCRPGHPEDCATGFGCYEDSSGERFCTTNCKAKVSTPNGNVSVDSDDCPTGSYCFFGGPSAVAEGVCPNGTCQGLCAADPQYNDATCYPLK